MKATPRLDYWHIYIYCSLDMAKSIISIRVRLYMSVSRIVQVLLCEHLPETINSACATPLYHLSLSNEWGGLSFNVWHGGLKGHGVKGRPNSSQSMWNSYFLILPLLSAIWKSNYSGLTISPSVFGTNLQTLVDVLSYYSKRQLQPQERSGPLTT